MMSWMQWTRHNGDDVTTSWMIARPKNARRAKGGKDAGVKAD